MSEGIFPPVKCATGLRYAPTSSMSKISLFFLDFWRKQKMASSENNENKRTGRACVGTQSPTKVPPDVPRLFAHSEP